MIPRLLALVLALCAGVPVLACRQRPAPEGPPIVVLISIDGFRWDYLDTLQPPALLGLAAEGVRADGLIPQFPSKTFPNHYTIVTGMRLATHGILSNNMVAPDVPGRFSLGNRDVLADPRWWGGEPIWNTAERQGVVSSSLFWPGSEAPIGGRRATYWMPYEHAMPNDRRVDLTLEWLRAPDGKAARFATIYFSDVDSAGHSFGPDSPEVREAVASVDRSVARLVDGVRAAGLVDRVHYVIVSDHGMAALSPDRVIVLDELIDPSTVEIIDSSPVLGLAPRDGNVEALYAALSGKHPNLAVYRSGELPEHYGLRGHPRLPPIVGIADEGWQIASRTDLSRWAGDDRPAGGNHGYDPQLGSMHGLFIAAGPRLHRGMRVEAFENIHLYELMCALLEIEPSANDGDPSVTRPMRLPARSPAGG